jgi:isoleucyl-tRNA synthetase
MFNNQKEFNLPEIEEKVLKFWAENDVFNKSVERRKGKKPFVFYEGPPTANGRPAIHHVLGRAFKDVVLRYKTMRGYHVPRRAGWDTHGLPVELEVEKELGIKSKPEIEKFGIAAFNERAKASVWKYKDEWEKLTARTGMWLDFAHPYITYDNSYIESLWWVFSQFSKRKLLKKSYRVVPWCPRCETSLSSHELNQPGAYKKAKDPSLYVKFKLKNDKLEAKSYLLVWTTTPWTLPANVAVAVNPALTYTKYKIGDEYIWSYNPPPAPPGVMPEVMEKLSGKKLTGLEYEPLYETRKLKNKKTKKQAVKNFYRILAADFVETEQGTGFVHIAPAFGEDDFRLIDREFGVEAGKIPITINESGRVLKGFPGEGKFVKEADKDIVADLTKRGLVLSFGAIEHDYPFCWRCGTALLYVARSSWFVEMSRLRDKLLKENDSVRWIPENLRAGRFGEWLREVKDWAISRERYWGTPLPIWECGGCGSARVVGSLAELNKYAWGKNEFFVMRHGEATHNVAGTIAAGKETTKTRSVLTEKGAAQAAVLAKKLKKEKIDFIFASPYHRTKQTASIVAKALGIKKIVYDKRLSEIDTGIFNNRLIQEHKDFFGGDPLKEFSKAPPGGESLAAVQRRMVEVFRDINGKHQNKRILIVSHGDPLWVLEGALRGLKPAELLSFDYLQTGEYRKLPASNFPYDATGALDMHRPYVDAVYLRCGKCDSRMTRVKEVADVWFDSGAMPFAQWHYPFENKKLIESGAQYPTDYIVEGMDQTRGWFYTLLAVAVALGRRAPYKTVAALGLVLDKNGVKMSKSKGNVVDPWAMFGKFGADVVRWHFYTMNPPWEAKRFDEKDLLSVSRRFFAIIYNSYIFLKTYGDLNGADMNKFAPTHVLDRFIFSRVSQTARLVTEKMDNYEITEAGRVLEVFVDDLSRWYIRRSRRRFQRPEPRDLKSASVTLHLVLCEFAKLIAPMAPFFAEGLHLALSALNSGKKIFSVHLEDWGAGLSSPDRELLLAMAEVRRLASEGLALRAKLGIKVRQPLQKLKIKNKKLKISEDAELQEILKDEVNVKEIIFDSSIKDDLELDTLITPELKAEGLLREFTRLIQDLRQDANYKPGEEAALFVELPTELLRIFQPFEVVIKNETSLRELNWKRTDKFDAEISTKMEDASVWLGIRR